MNHIFKLLGCLGLVVLSTYALAKGADTNNTEFTNTVKIIVSWSTGTLGTVLSLSCLLIGGALGIAQSNPQPAIMGVMMATFITFGPRVLINLSNDVTEPTAIVAKTDTQPLNPKHAKELFAKEKVNPVLNPIPLKKEFKNKEEYQY